MEKKEFDELMNSLPSTFYKWIWRSKLTKKQKDFIVGKYEEKNPVFEAEPELFVASESLPNFVIQTPIWAERAIGLNEAKLKEENLIEIAYRDKDGNKLYPHLYSITKFKALVYPVKKIKGNDIRIIPIEDLNIKEEH